ncbi:MAG: hypothetical protein COV72_01365 [Candidatus Omnitrophica bacterium CG11_big_fil_rev_8_21_14_0_20_42_13]|uniref:Archease domain-containing protein n=1 Tax=Candidatus Ghiorseimicrobium undicola TaxID=1974746 RepID=A0A2H0LZM2_9BACT|nr:MAG: hypothetical protein COV72_01365 [Candidatus Omnitrophica bacterium CG11_big_fil_rev_8_21_14_0_20_42_13]
MPNYEFLEHTADIGIRLNSRSLQELFKNAALAMFDIIAERKSESGNRGLEKLTLKQEAENKEELLVNWLNELLSLSSVKEIIFTDFKIDKLSETALEAAAFSRPVADFTVNTEIKAATRHELKIEKTGSLWQAEVIFDV